MKHRSGNSPALFIAFAAMVTASCDVSNLPPTGGVFDDYYDLQQIVEGMPQTSPPDLPTSGSAVYEGHLIGEFLGTKVGYAWGDASFIADFDQQTVSGAFEVKTRWSGGGGHNFGKMTVSPAKIVGSAFSAPWTDDTGEGSGMISGEFRGAEHDGLLATVNGHLSYEDWEDWGWKPVSSWVQHALELKGTVSAVR